MPSASASMACGWSAKRKAIAYNGDITTLHGLLYQDSPHESGQPPACTGKQAVPAAPVSAAGAAPPLPPPPAALRPVSSSDSGRTGDESRRSLERFGAVNNHVQETLAGVRTVRALGLQARSRSEFGRLTQQAAEASYTAQRWEAATAPAERCTAL